MDIKDLNIQDLIGDDPSTLTDLSDPTPAQIDQWLQAAKIYPGTTRVQSKDLYARYETWCEKNNLTPTAFRWWGREMSGRFRKSRSEKGNVYWISRQENTHIPKNVHTKKPTT